MAASSSTTRPTTVIFVRHGQTPSTGKVLPGRAPGLHLSDTGKAQADAVARSLASLPRVDAVYTSPMERTRETAAPIAAARGLKQHVLRGLVECDFGDWTGQELKVLRRLREWRTVLHYPSGFRFPGGESFAEMQQRMVDAVDRITHAHPGGVVVAVSHADPIKAAVAHALGVHLDLFQRLVVGPCSVTSVMYGGEGPVVLAVNTPPDGLQGLRPS
ncbi:MAG: MSMEG_4193 family putative phosphomutase [Acidimicrobiales bacterium]|nr:MSMEG_4193 family putative phosphomutase [Acidimicrobiales bacterium]